jgi:hypothetical protein
LSEFEHFAEQIDDRLKEGAQAAEAFGQFSEGFGQLVRTRLYLEPFNHLLARIGNYHTITGSVVSSQRCILRKSPFSIWSLMRLEDEERPLTFTPVAGLKLPTHPGSIEVRRYKTPPGFDPGQYSSETRLELDTHFRQTSGDPAILHDGESDVLDLGRGGPSAEPQFILSVGSAPLGGFTWDFDRTSLHATGVRAMNGLDSGLETIVEFLGTIRAQAALPLMDKLSRHPRHFIRWKAIQAAYGIDRDRGLEMARLALSDPHPEIRSLAATALERFGSNAHSPEATHGSRH